MKFRSTHSLILLVLLALGARAEPTPDQEIADYSNFAMAVANLDGQVQSVISYCEPHVSDNIIRRTRNSWQVNHQKYENSVPYITQQLLDAKVEPERHAEVLAGLKANADAWFDSARSSNRLLKTLQDSKLPKLECARTLGAISSTTFSIERLNPDAHAYWLSNKAAGK